MEYNTVREEMLYNYKTESTVLEPHIRVQTCLWTIDDLLLEGAVRSYLERCSKAVDPQTSVSPLIAILLTGKKNDAPPEDFPAKSNAKPTTEEMLHRVWLTLAAALPILAYLEARIDNTMYHEWL